LFHAIELRRCEIHHVVVYVLRHLGARLIYRLEHITQFGARLRAFVLQFVVFFFELLVVVLFLVTVRILYGSALRLVFVDVLLLALLASGIVVLLHLVGKRVDVGAAIGEDILDGNNFCVQIRDLFLQFVAARLGLLIGLLVGLFQFAVIGAVGDLVQ